MTLKRPLPSIVLPANLDISRSLMTPLHNSVAQEFSAVNTLIVKRLNSNVDLVESIGHHIIDAGGKRLRPLLVILSAMANGYRGDQHISAAAVIEFIHTATLLHDDVVDVSTLRRGRLTANSQWGNASSVLVGDFLYSRAFQMLVEIGDLSIMRIVADASNLISEGEVQQLSNAGNPDITQTVYNDVIYKKTAVLYEAAARIGAVIASQDSNAMANFGRHLGMAFQITDDVMDYHGNVGNIGKNIGADLSEGKMTLPLIYARDRGKVEDVELIRNAIKGRQKEQFLPVRALIEASGGLDLATQIAKEAVVSARRAIADLPNNAYTEALLALAEYSVSRVK